MAGVSLSDRHPLMVVGAGPAGALVALYLARAGHEVEVYESRPDLRRMRLDAGRSINLALATRGLVPLTELGVAEPVDAIAVPMAGRWVHAGGTVELQPYGLHDEVIHSVSRPDLNAILLDAAEATGRVRFHFDHHCRSVDFDAGLATFSSYDDPVATTEAPFGTLFGCDGAASVVRRHLLAANGGEVSIEPLDHGYKELTIPPAPGGGFRLDPNGLHIWPRGELMLIALANPEGDFTTTLFMPHRGPTDSFEALSSAERVVEFFATHFPDAGQHLDDLTEQFFTNPTGDLATVRTRGWCLDHRAVILGDAAHGIVPFHGQGMNLAMESARLLDRFLGAHPNDVAAAFAAFEANRKPDAEAIADMALDNYLEMRAGVVDPGYVLRRSLALELERRFPQRVAARYGMVMFTTMPYAEVKARNERQQAIFARLTERVTSLDDIDWTAAEELVEELGPLPRWQ
jgi:kynurenine 3-monooxygenase